MIKKGNRRRTTAIEPTHINRKFSPVQNSSDLTMLPKFRVGIVGIYHESNTFIPSPTDLPQFQNRIWLRGEEIRKHYQSSHHEIGGFFESLDAGGIAAVPLFFSCASPWGPVTDRALDAMWDCVLAAIENAGPLDGILAAAHGAGVNPSRTDLDGWWLENLRGRLGKNKPLIATIDPHANITPKMVESCDALVAYRENPHLDQRQRGAEAATIMVRTLEKTIAPTMAASFPPVCINIEKQRTSEEPMASVHRKMEEIRCIPGVVSASFTMGFPYADVVEMGAGILVVTDNDPELAERHAREAGTWLVENAPAFRGELLSPECAIERLADLPKPVGLLDMGDNTGAGAPGDSTVIAHLCNKRHGLRTLFFVPDPESVQLAVAAGVGGIRTFAIGGKLPMTPSGPLELEAEVVGLYDGVFSESKPRHGGQTGGTMGPSAVVKDRNGMTVLLMSRRGGPTVSAQPFFACGIDPSDFDVIILKGVHGPVGAYEEICPVLLRVNTPGVTCADLGAFSFHHRRVPLFPFEPVAADNANPEGPRRGAG